MSEGLVLVVDDEAALREVLRESLHALGYRAVTAASATAALEIAEATVPDVVLTDVSMPGMSGIELTAKLKADPRFRAVPVVVLTAVADLGARRAALEAGADDFFRKPFDLLELRARLASLVRIRRLHLDLDARNLMLRKMFGRYVSEEVAARLVDAPDGPLDVAGDKREVTVLFGDLRGFTPLAEHLDPHDVVEILNAYLGSAIDAVIEFEGTVDKLLGDGIMAVFGAPVAHADDPLRAIRCALRIQERVRTLALPRFPGLRLQVGIGINTGVAVAGNIGNQQRADYTVIGGDVNVAQRFEASAGPGQVLITDATYAHVLDAVVVRDLGALRVKGRSDGVAAYDVLGLV